MFDFKNIVKYDDKEGHGSAEIVYDLEYLNKRWDFLIQRFVILHVNKAGFFHLESHFELYQKDQDFPSILSDFSRQDKVNLWKTIFELKAYHIRKYQPDIIEHFVDAEFPFEKRVKLYKAHLKMEGYRYEVAKNFRTFYLIKDSIQPSDLD